MDFLERHCRAWTEGHIALEFADTAAALMLAYVRENPDDLDLGWMRIAEITGALDLGL